MAGACKGQTGPAPGGESATGERQSSALRTGRGVGSCVAQPARIKTPSAGTMHRFIAAEGPVYARVDQVESLRPDRFSSREHACRFLPNSKSGRDDEDPPALLACSGHGIVAILAPNTDLLGNFVNGDFALELPDSANRESR
jgi:hypothetical protein